MNVQRAHLIKGGLGINAGGAVLSVCHMCGRNAGCEQVVNTRISVHVYVVLTCINMRDFAFSAYGSAPEWLHSTQAQMGRPRAY